MASKSLLITLLIAAFVTADEADNTSTSTTCTEANWSRASAFWFLFTLAIACLAHPRGSLLFHQAGRVWRFSPLYLLVEDVVIVKRLISGMWGNGWRSWRTTLRLYAYVLLALREGNAWDQAEWDGFFDKEENARYLRSDGGDEDEWVALLPSTGTTGVDVGGNDSLLESVVRRTASIPEETLEEGPEELDTNIKAGASMKLWFELGKSTLSNERLLAQNGPLRHFLDARSRRNLERVQDYEKGPTYRALLWLPIIQQFCKSWLVKGAPWTIFFGWVFLVSFMIVEILLIASRSPLKEQEIAKAVALMRMWGEMERIPAPRQPAGAVVNRSGIWLKPKSFKTAVASSIALVAMVDWILFMKVIAFSSICSRLAQCVRQLFTSLGGSGVLLLFIGPIYTFLALFDFYLLFCLCLFGLGGPYWVANGVDEGYEGSRHVARLSKSEWPRHAPAFYAVWTVVLAIIVYFGLGAENGLAYNCSTTWKSGVYDLLG